VQDMGCYLEHYQALVGAWAARFSWRSVEGHVGTSGGKIYMGPMILCGVENGTATDVDLRGSRFWKRN